MARVVIAVRRRGDATETDFEVATDVSSAELVAQVARQVGEPAGSGALELRAVSLGRALQPDETLGDAGLFDGAIMVLARSSDPAELPWPGAGLALAHQSGSAAAVHVPPPPALVVPLPSPEPPRRRWPFIAAGAIVIALLGLGVFWFLQRDQTTRSVSPAPTLAPLAEPTTAPTAASLVLGTVPPASATTTVASQPTPDDQAAWRDLLVRLDAVWGTDWQAAISLLQAFHTQYPTQTAASDKLYSALVEYGHALRDAGATSAAADALDQAIRLQPQRFEAREELAAMAPEPTPAPQPLPAAPPPLPAPTIARVAPPEPAAPPPPQPGPSCDVSSTQNACALADGSQVQDSIAAPDGRHYYWFGVPVAGMQLHIEVGGTACPCTLSLFSDQVDEGRTPVDTASTPLDRLMADPGPYLLELAPSPTLSGEAPYALAVSLRVVPPTPTPTPVPEEAPPPLATPAEPVVVPVSVPPVVGHSASEASDRLRAVGLVPQTRAADSFSPTGPGTVAVQDPPAGTAVDPGGGVILLIASGDVIVPAVVGMPEEQALAQLRAAGFQVTTRHAPRSNVPAGQTASTEPPPGAGAPAGTVVLLTISQGP